MSPCKYFDEEAPIPKSAAAIARKVGALAAPVDGPERKVFALCEARVAVRVPVVVTGEPLTTNMAGNDKATDVTPVFEIVRLPSAPTTLIPVPAAMVLKTNALAP